MRQETPENAFSKKEGRESVSINREVLDRYAEANRPGREHERRESEETQRLEKSEMEARSADERKMQEIREGIRKIARNVPLYGKEGAAYMPGADMEEGADEKTEEMGEEGLKFGEDVETTTPDSKEEKPQADNEKADAREANGSENEKKDSEEIIPEEIGNDEAKKEDAEKIIPEETEKDKKEKADAEVKTDDTKEEKDEKPKTEPVKETKKEPELSDLTGETDYEIRKVKKEEVEPITGEPDEGKKNEKVEEKETSKTEKKEKEPDKGDSAEEKTGQEKPKAAAEEKIRIPESESSKVRKEMTGEINDLWRVFQTGQVDEKARKTVEKYSVDAKDREKVYDRIMKLGGPQMVATGSDEMFKATKITEGAVEAGNLYEMYVAAKMSESAVETLATAMGAQIEMVRATREQKKLLNRIIKRGSLGYDIREENKRKQPETGTFTHDLSNSNEKNLWNAAMGGTEKSNKKALEVLLGKTGRKGRLNEIIKSEDFHMESSMGGGRLHFDITWKGEDGEKHNLHYMLDGTAAGDKAYKPDWKNYIYFRKKYPTVFTIIEDGEAAIAEDAERSESSASEGAARTESDAREDLSEIAGEYPKSAAFMTYYREVYKNAGGEYEKGADDLEARIREGRKKEARKALEEFIASAEEALGEGGLDKEDEKMLKKLSDMAKAALQELGEKEEAEAGKEGHPDVLAVKDLEPGDVAVVKKITNGAEREFRYKMEDSGIAYVSKETEGGEFTQGEKVGENFVITKGVNGVVDIEVIKGEKKEKKKE